MNVSLTNNFIDATLIKNFLKRRDPFSNKGNYGHACLLAGSYGMLGAAVLSSKACLRSGVGKLTTVIPKTGFEIMQISAPEAMVKTWGKKFIKNINEDFKDYNALGIGPGIGIYKSHYKLLKHIFLNYKKPIVIDADALNVLSLHKQFFSSIPANSILTPHPKEFERLFGKTETEEDRNKLALQMSNKYKIYIVLKGHHTLIATPDKIAYFNSTGNPGMATGGSGDVLTGILTGLLAQKYSPLETCLLGVYLHGIAGDIAAKNLSEEAMIAGDIVDNLGEAFKNIANK